MNPAAGWIHLPAVSLGGGSITTRLNRRGAVPFPLISSNPMKFMLVAELVVVGTDMFGVFFV
jgi:hypothetical protein